MKSPEVWATEFQGIGLLPRDVRRIREELYDYTIGVALNVRAEHTHPDDGLIRWTAGLIADRIRDAKLEG